MCNLLVLTFLILQLFVVAIWITSKIIFMFSSILFADSLSYFGRVMSFSSSLNNCKFRAWTFTVGFLMDFNGGNEILKSTGVWLDPILLHFSNLIWRMFSDSYQMWRRVYLFDPDGKYWKIGPWKVNFLVLSDWIVVGLMFPNSFDKRCYARIKRGDDEKRT